MKPHFTNTGNPIDFPKTEKMMDERIKELAEQQGFTGPNYLISSQELEKFAESIVRECIAIVEGMAPGYTDYRNQIEDSLKIDTVAKIKRHFGLLEGAEPEFDK